MSGFVGPWNTGIVPRERAVEGGMCVKFADGAELIPGLGECWRNANVAVTDSLLPNVAQSVFHSLAEVAGNGGLMNNTPVLGVP